MGLLARPEFWALLLIAFVFFGAKRLPEAGSAIGKTIREFQKSMHEVTEPEQPTAAIPPAAAAPQQLATATHSAAEAAPAEPMTPTPPAQ
jgi:sec-independent protein translocase protein TatA